jgi:hypothetical protein
MSFTAITVTGDFKDAAGNTLAGSVQFTLSGPMQDSADKIIVAPVQITAEVTAGALSQSLYANDDTTTQPPGTSYAVVEQVGGVSRRYNITVPHAAGSGTIDLAQLAPPTAGSAAT